MSTWLLQFLGWRFWNAKLCPVYCKHGKFWNANLPPIIIRPPSPLEYLLTLNIWHWKSFQSNLTVTQIESVTDFPKSFRPHADWKHVFSWTCYYQLSFWERASESQVSGWTCIEKIPLWRRKVHCLQALWSNMSSTGSIIIHNFLKIMPNMSCKQGHLITHYFLIIGYLINLSIWWSKIWTTKKPRFKYWTRLCWSFDFVAT